MSDKKHSIIPLTLQTVQEEQDFGRRIHTYLRPSEHIVSISKKINEQRDIETINILLKNTDFDFLFDNISKALRTSEIAPVLHATIHHRLKEVFAKCVRSISVNDVRKEDTKLLRWLLKTFGVFAAWEGVEVAIRRYIQSANYLSSGLSTQYGCPTRLEYLEEKLIYFTEMLQEDTYFDVWGGPLLANEHNADGRNKVLSRSVGCTLFTADRDGSYATGELLAETYDALKRLRDTMEFAWDYPARVKWQEGCKCKWASKWWLAHVQAYMGKGEDIGKLFQDPLYYLSRQWHAAFESIIAMRTLVPKQNQRATMEIIMLLNSVQALLEKLTPDHPGFHRDWVWAQAMLEQATGMLDPSVLSQWLAENLAQIALSNPRKHRTAEQHLSPDPQEFTCPKSGSNSPTTMPSEVSSLASCPPPLPTWAKVTGEKSQDYPKNIKRHIYQVVDSASDLEEEGFAEEYFDSDTHEIHSEIEEREETLDTKTISSNQKQSHGEDFTIRDVLTPSSRGSGSFSNLYDISKKHEDIGEPSEYENDWESIFTASETGPERCFVSSPAPSPEEESQWQEMRKVEL